MSTKIVKAPTLPVALPEDDMPTVQTGLMMGAPAQIALEPGLQQGAATQGPVVSPQTAPSGGLEPMTQQAPLLSQAPVTDEFSDIRPAAHTQTLIGLQDKSFSAAPIEIAPAPLELPPLTPFADVPAVNLNRAEAFTELDALKSLGKIHYEVGDSGRVKLFAPAFDVGFRHASQSELMAADHWFDFPEPSMAVETARLASWAFDKGIEQISHNGFFGDSGADIDFGPKFPGDTPHKSTAPAVSHQADAAFYSEPTKPELPTLPQHPPAAAAPAAQAAAPAAQAAAPAAQAAAPAAQAAAPATAQAAAQPNADAAQPKPADAGQKEQSFLGKIAEKAGNAVRKFLQLDIVGVKGTDKKTGFKFSSNLFKEYTRAPHENFMRSSRANQQEAARQEKIRQEHENQRAIDRELASNQLQQIALKRAALQQADQQKIATESQAQVQTAQETKQTEQKLHPAATGAFHSPFANLHAEKLFGQLDAKKQGK